MRRFTNVTTMLAFLVGLLVGACAEGVIPAPVDEWETPPLEDDLIAPSPGGKFDTGYYSNLAAELVGRFSSQRIVDVSNRSLADQQAELARLTNSTLAVRNLIDPQLKYAKNRLNSLNFHLNLSSGDLEVTEISLTNGIITIRYQTAAETLVTQADLDDEGITIQDVLQTSVTAVVPDDPTRMAADVGTACLNDNHEGDPQDYNYFYYFDPDKEGCAEAMAHAGIGRVDANFDVVNLAPSETVFPEYDQLVADSRIDVVVFFGAADHDWEPGQWDWGTYNHSNFKSDLVNRGFTRSDLENGDLYSRTVDGLVENVTVIGPETLKLLRDDADGLFETMVRQNELIFYNGHSFYGSLDVLDDPDIYPGHYQIFFINSCWSYEYYTKQIFRNNETAEDPDGWALADVVNDTESGWFHNNVGTSRILLTNILAGAENNGVEGDRYYTWDRIIGAMNQYAVEQQQVRGSETHEIFGVSGVTTNRFDPTAPIVPPAETARYEANNQIAIPDNDNTGISDTIVVPSGHGTLQNVNVEVEIEHTWRGDLDVTLAHGGQSHTLHSRDGGSADNLSLDVSINTFAGLDAAGDWTLTVVDRAGQDTGSLMSWAIEIPEADDGGGNDITRFESSNQVAIPDNDPTGASDTITVPSGSGNADSLRVEVDITHTWRGDLTVTLHHGDRYFTLHSKAGGSADNLNLDMTTAHFAGMDASGQWTLRIIDSANRDTGELVSWAIEIN